MSAALVAEATRRSAVVWVAVPGAPAERPVWHVWHDGAAYVVTGEGEQQLPGALEAGRAVVLVRSRERQADRVVQWPARVERVEPGSARWQEVAPLLSARRLHAPDGAAQVERWAERGAVLRLVPEGALLPTTDEERPRPPA